jgi:ribosomal protein L22
MADETEETPGATPDEAPAVEPETSAVADGSQGASSEAVPTAAEEAATPPHGDELAGAAAAADEELVSEDVAEEPEAEVSVQAPAAEAQEKAAKPKRADRAASTPRRQRRGERGRAGREPGEPLPVVRAQAKYVRSSARKARLVCDHIRGKSVVEARAILAVTPRAIARDWSKLLESAVANAEHNHELVGEDLVVKAVHADEGPTIKRFRPRAMGRATRIRKRTSHLTILLTPKD